MKAPGVWRLEWRIALRRRRLMAFNLAIPLLLVAPVTLAGAPAAHSAAVIAVLFVLFGVFGSAVPLVRDARRGLLGRILLAGLSPRTIVLGKTVAGATIDLLQLLPATALVLAVARPAPTEAALLLVHLAAALVSANALGLWTAAVGRSIAETALFSSIVALLALHASGVFRTPQASSVAAVIESWSPFVGLHEQLLSTLGRASSAPPEVLLWAPGLVALSVAVAGVFSRAWLHGHGPH